MVRNFGIYLEMYVRFLQGWIKFGGGGEAQKMCVDAHHEHGAQCLLRPGSRARLKALEALRVFDDLSSYLSLISKHSDTIQSGIKKT